VIILDTNVVSEAMRPEPDPGVLDWIQAQLVETLFLSAITVAELRAGVESSPEGRKKKILRENLESRFLPLFTGRVLGFDNSCTQAYAEIYAINKRLGSGVSLADALVAAIAATHVMSVATRDTRPFVSSGVAVINPWDFGQAGG
jgi:predicted nucleic acid-binding protein